MRTRFDSLILKHGPWLAAGRDCPDAEPDGDGFSVDTDSPCFQAIVKKHFKPRSTTPPLPEKSAGPGDLIEWVAKHTGADNLARLYTYMTGKPCRCNERRDKINAWWDGIKSKLSRSE